MRPYRARSAAMIFIALVAAACLDTATTELDAPHSVASVTVEPSRATVSVGKHVALDAQLEDASGSPMTGSVAWTSRDTTIAIVSPNGEVTAVRVGSTQISAVSSSKEGTATVTVTPPSVASVQLTPASATLAVHDQLQLSATPRDDQGNPLSGYSVSLSSSNPSVASVSATGMVTALAEGTTTITATSDTVSSTATITVTPQAVDTVDVVPTSTTLLPQQSLQISVTLRDATGATLSGRTITWTTSNSSVATVSSTGVVTGAEVGTATVTATSGKKKGNVKVLVSQEPVASVSVSPASVSITKGATATLTATPMDNLGNPLTGRIVTWASSNTGAATVSSTGVVTGAGAGTATITATSEGMNGTAHVTVAVTATPVASVSVTPASASVIIGATQQLTASPKDSGGNTLTGRTITWSSSNTSVATVAASGLVTAVATGSATITATSEGQTGTSQITVIVPPVASLVVSPHAASLIDGGTVQLSATTRDAGGNVLTGRSIAWSTDSASVATVSSSGLVTGVAPGTATIYAVSEGKGDSSAITVNVPSVATVSVGPSSMTLRVGGATRTLTATLRDASGNVLTGRTIAWTSSTTATATVSSSGVVTPVAVGATTVTATSEGKTGSSSITVTLVPVSTVAVSPASTTLDAGGTQQLTATLKDSAGNTLTGRTITWSSSNTAAATVSTSGKVTAVAAGSATITATSEGKSGGASVTVNATQPPPPSTSHSGFFVAPNGSSGGSGASGSPWDLATAASGAGGKIQPGDTVWLRGGTYGNGETSSAYHFSLSGSSAAPVIIRQYPGERATIDGNITADGNYVWFWGFEVANTSTTTQNVIGVDSHCPGCRFINMVVHDHSGDGFGMWSEGPNQVAYGNVIYNNGFHGSTSTTFGHGIYAQNNTGTKLLQDNILFDQFGYGIHVYGSDAAFLNNFTIDGNASFNSGLGTGMDYHIGGGSPVNNLVFTNNMSYRMADNRVNTVRLGYNWGPNNPSATVTGNYLVGQLLLEHWNTLSFDNNTIVDPYGAAVTLEQNTGQALTTSNSWDGNSYVKTTSSYPVAPFQLSLNGVTTTYVLSAWQSLTGFDRGSSVTSAMPTTTKIVVEPNAYEAGRANILIYNWGGQGAVTVDLSSVLHAGDQYEVVNAQNFYGSPVTTGTYGGGAITIPITTVTPPRPIGGTAPMTTGTEFNAYVVLKTN